MTRKLGDLDAEELERIRSEVHQEAEQAKWHQLTNTQRADIYRQWEEKHDLRHAAVKDGLMKGFDAAQHIPKSGEAAVHQEVCALLDNSPVPYWKDKVSLWNGRAFADFVVGVNRGFLTHTVELEPAPTWQKGVSQALWYKAAYLQETDLQALPTLILFGDVTERRWKEITLTCLDQRILLVTHDLKIDGSDAPYSIESLLGGS